MKKILPRDITSYDLIKMTAVLLMLVDHVGYYFYPDDMWWRVLGRMCVPIWFFLIGYAKTRDLDPRFLIGGAILVVGDVISGHCLFPANILFTMLLFRMALDPVMLGIGRGGARTLWAFAVLAVLLALPTTLVFEYGTSGFLLVVFGWMMRHQQDRDMPETIANDTVNYFMIFTFVSFVLFQTIVFGFNQPQFYVLSAGLLVVFGVLNFFRPAGYPGLTRGLGPLAGVVRLFGRRTLEIYVGHLILFKILGMITQPDRFAFLQWTWFQS